MESGTKRLHFLLAHRDGRRCVANTIRCTRRADGRRNIDVQHDESGAALALDLNKHEIIGHHFDRREIDIHRRAALRATRLLANARENLVQCVGGIIHHSVV